MSPIAQILQQLHQSPIGYYPCYARIMGSVSGGVILSQLLFHYGKYGRRFYKNDKELLAETCCSVRELREAKKRLKDLPFLTVTVEGLPATTWYEVLPEALFEALAVQPSSHDAVQTGENDGVPTGSHDGVQAITETASESTTERKDFFPSEKSFSGARNEVSPPSMPKISESTRQLLQAAKTQRKRKPVEPISESDWPGLRGMLTVFEIPVAPLDDNGWWNALSYVCNNPTPTWLERQFAKMHTWLNENPRKRPTTRWKTFVRGWLTRSYERERKAYASQKAS